MGGGVILRKARVQETLGEPMRRRLVVNSVGGVEVS